MFTILGVVAIFAFFSCGSTPTAEPEVDTTEAQAPKEDKEETVTEDFTQANQTLLAQADAARQKAIDAGAEKYFPEVLAADDKYYDDVKNNISSRPAEDHSAGIKEVITRYEALATASYAKELKLKADEFGVSDTGGERAISNFESSDKGSDMRNHADNAFEIYSKLLLAHMGTMAKSERNAALEAKKKADSVKAGVAKKTEYKAASDTFKKADSSYVTKDLEGAYKGYHSAKNAFNGLYESIAEKRAAAQAAIERAKKRVAEAESYTIEADSIAPIQGEVAGIEKEDAVLLEEDSFANPDDAVIDVESSAEAKAAATIDEAVNSAIDAAGGESK